MAQYKITIQGPEGKTVEYETDAWVLNLQDDAPEGNPGFFASQLITSGETYGEGCFLLSRALYCLTVKKDEFMIQGQDYLLALKKFGEEEVN